MLNNDNDSDISKARRTAKESTSDSESGSADLEPRVAGNVGSKQHPPPGFTPIPGTKHGGWHKKTADGWQSWYPGVGVGTHKKEKLSDAQHQKAYESIGERHRKFLDQMQNTDVRRFEKDKKASDKPKKPKLDEEGNPIEAPEDPHADIRKKYSAMKLNRPIPLTAKNLKEHFTPSQLGTDAVHQGAVLSWTNEDGVRQFAYTTEHDRRTAHVKWTRLATLVPQMEAATRSLRKAMTTGSQRERDAAVALALIEETGLRPGSREAAARATKVDKFGREKIGTTGATTLKPKHLSFDNDTAPTSVRIQFIGKANKKNTRVVTDPELVKELHDRAKNPTPDGFLFSATDADTNKVMKTHFGKFKQKDLRTLQGSMTAADELAQVPPIKLTGNAKKDIKALSAVIDMVSARVAERLDNGMTMSRGSYVHPSLFVTWMKRSGATDNEINALFKGKKGSLHPLRNMTAKGRELLEDALKLASSESDSGYDGHEGDTDEEYAQEYYPHFFESGAYEEVDEVKKGASRVTNNDTLERGELTVKDYARELNLWADRIEKSNYNNLLSETDDALHKADKPPKGFTPIPGSKKGGFHKRVGNKYQTWYPGHGVKSHEGKNENDPGHAQAMDNLHTNDSLINDVVKEWTGKDMNWKEEDVVWAVASSSDTALLNHFENVAKKMEMAYLQNRYNRLSENEDPDDAREMNSLHNRILGLHKEVYKKRQMKPSDVNDAIKEATGVDVNWDEKAVVEAAKFDDDQTLLKYFKTLATKLGREKSQYRSERVRTSR